MEKDLREALRFDTVESFGLGHLFIKPEEFPPNPALSEIDISLRQVFILNAVQMLQYTRDPEHKISLLDLMRQWSKGGHLIVSTVKHFKDSGQTYFINNNDEMNPYLRNALRFDTLESFKLGHLFVGMKL